MSDTIWLRGSSLLVIQVQLNFTTIELLGLYKEPYKRLVRATVHVLSSWDHACAR